MARAPVTTTWGELAVGDRSVGFGPTTSVGHDDGVPGVISRKFSVREIATKSLLVARHDYI